MNYIHPSNVLHPKNDMSETCCLCLHELKTEKTYKLFHWSGCMPGFYNVCTYIAAQSEVSLPDINEHVFGLQVV